MTDRHITSLLLIFLVELIAPFSAARAVEPVEDTAAAIAEYRAMFGDDNPADLWIARGKDLWQEVRGPRRQPLAGHCDLGEGAGVTHGAYAHLPRYFADSRRVQDLESRLLTCMTRIQGFTDSELIANRFGDGERKSDLEALAAWLVAESRGVTVAVPMTQPSERAAFANGKAIFYYRAGPHDFSCATCHGQTGKRIRLQALPNLGVPAEARAAYTTWPAYRVSQGELRTFEWRLADCFRQQRLPGLLYGSDAAIALTSYIAASANGGVMAAPAIKR